MKNNIIKFGGFRKPKLRDLEFYFDDKFDLFRLILNDFNSFLGIYKPIIVDFETRSELESFIDKNEDLRISSIFWKYDQADNWVLVLESI